MVGNLTGDGLARALALSRRAGLCAAAGESAPADDTTEEIASFGAPLMVWEMNGAGPGESDATDNAINGTATGALTYGVDDPALNENSIDFGGAGYISATNALLPDVDTNWSMVGFIQIKGTPSYSGGQSVICFTQKNSTNWLAVNLTSKTNLQIIGRLRNSGGSAWANATVADVEDSEWHAWGITYTETSSEHGTYRVYWDGVEELSVSGKSSVPMDTSCHVMVGAYYNNALRDYGDSYQDRCTLYTGQVLSGQAMIDFANVVDGTVVGRFPNI